ncbi:flavodoxin domain-containing protein [candidate division WOR-3 bacterium]|nr:flavodoxin domain-containing protein [candidate division WOR-3 bacterium]
MLIIYYSRTGNTEKMANLICKGVEKESVEVEMRLLLWIF